MKAEELRERLEQARLDIESGDPERMRQAQTDLEAIASEAEEAQAEAFQPHAARIERIIQGEGAFGGFARWVGTFIVILGVLTFIAGIVWSFNNGLSWIWDLLALAGIVLGVWLLAVVVTGILKGLFVFGAATRFTRRQRPKAVARARKRHERQLAAQQAREERQQKRAETAEKVRSLSLQGVVVGSTFRALELLGVWASQTLIRVRLQFDSRARGLSISYPKAREIVALPYEERQQFLLEYDWFGTSEPESEPESTDTHEISEETLASLDAMIERIKKEGL